MTAALVVAGAALLVLATVAWVGWPLVRGSTEVDPPDPRAVALLARREGVLATLRDLQADHADGRLGDEDYKALRAEVMADGARVLAALDALGEDAAGRSAELTAQLEAEIRALGGGRPAADEADPVADVRPAGDSRPASAERVAAPSERAGASDARARDRGEAAPDATPVERAPEGPICAACGHAAAPEDRFCARCGQPLAEGA